MINNETLLALCRKPIVTWVQLKHAGVKNSVLTTYGESLLTCLRDANANPPPLPPPVKHREIEPIEEERETRMKDWRRSEAEKRKVPLQVVLPAKALEYLKRYGGGDLSQVPQLGEKRLRMYGEKLAQLAR